MFKKLFICILSLVTLNAFALEIDEKLTMRIVKTSQSRKTILINRGVEDGLVKGDHAKFFLSIGVVARGVVVKLAPTRSVWSIYRLVNAEYLKDNQVMKLKITAPVKITKDDSKALVADDTPKSVMSGDPRDLGIPLADGANDLDEAEMMGEQGGEGGAAAGAVSASMLESTSLRERSKEMFATAFYSGLGAKASPDNGGAEFAGEASTILFNLGGEFYTKNEKKWQARFSLVVQYSILNTSIISNEGDSVTEKTSEYGGGFHWYPFTRPSRTYKLVPYARFVMLLGSVNTSYNPGASGGSSYSVGGSSMAYAFGGGYKYYLHNGFGARAEFEFYSRSDSFAADQNGTKWITSKSGPRVTFGFSYRW